MSKFPGYSFAELTTTDVLPHVRPRTIRNVEACFAALHPTGDFLAAHVDGSIRKDRYTHKNYSNGRAKIHFQGMQRARDGVHAFVSGGDSREPASHLFVLHMASRSPHSGWCTNVLNGGKAPATDRIARVLALSDRHWHAGGPSVLGDLLAVPLEADQEPSRTVFLDVSNPVTPIYLPALDIRGVSRSAGAVAVTRLPNGFFLCATHRDELTPSHIDFYLSADTDLRNGWKAVSLTWPYDTAINITNTRPRYQSIALLLDAEHPDDMNAKLYLIGTENTEEGAPLLVGDDNADLYRIEFDDILSNDPTLDGVTITQVDSKALKCRFGWGNFAAIGGVYVDSFGRLNLYAGAHWRPDELIHLMEFRCPIDENAASIAARERGWIELYEHHNFIGRRLTIFGDQNADIPDYSRIAVQGDKLDNQISSIRFQLPVGTTYRLFDRASFGGTSFDLVGTGDVRVFRDMAVDIPQLADRVSSSRFV